jgi:hypothetical protein
VTRRELWKAPAENGGVLIDPPLDHVPQLLETNRQRLTASKVTLLGQPLGELRARLQDSVAVVNDQALIPPAMARPRWPVGPVIASGHQAELCHPGVWFKSFAINSLARRNHAAPLHVIVDADTIKTTSVSLPAWQPDPARVHLLAQPFDAWDGEVPYLGREVRDPVRFREFAHTTQQVWGNWPFRPLLPEFWDEAVRTYDAQRQRLVDKFDERNSPTLMLCLARPRQILEEKWGCFNRERWLCLLDRQAFIGQIIADLPRFHSAYNESVRAYRRKYRLRSASHPVPALATDGDFFEAPFWWIDLNANRRHRLFVQARGDRLDLRPDRGGTALSVPLRSPFSSNEMVEHGVALVTRALTTTMFIRLCVADLFIHGIGGAKYDEVTDNIIRTYFGVEPPEYMVVSGTLRLPFPSFACTPDVQRRLQRELRDWRWNPDRHLGLADRAVAELVAEKERWRAATPREKAGRRERYRKLHVLTDALRALIPNAEVDEQRRRLENCNLELRANEILQRRDYPFVLYPEEVLKPFCTQFL